MCTSAIAHSDSAVGRESAGPYAGKCGLLHEGASAFAFALPHPALGGAGHGATTARPLPHSGADTPGSGRRTNDILYIRVRRREGENVLHRAASNNVDNFSVDNPLWITAAAGCRLLCGGRGRRCGRSVNADGESVNAGAEVQTRTGRVRKSFAGDGCSQGASFDPMAAISRRGQGGRIYNNTRARVLLRRMCVKPAALTTHSPPKTFARPRTATRSSRAFSHSLPALFRSPTQRRRTPAGCAMHSSPTSQHIPHRRPSPAPAAPRCLPFRSAPGTKKRHRTVDVRCRMSRSTVVAVGHWGW